MSLQTAGFGAKPVSPKPDCLEGFETSWGVFLEMWACVGNSARLSL